MYQPRLQEIIWCEKRIVSNNLNNLTTGDVGPADLNMEADSDAMLPKGIKAFNAAGAFRDSGSFGVSNTYIRFRHSADQLWQFSQALAGFANDARARTSQWQACNPAGDVQYHIDSSAATNTTVQEFHYIGVQVN
jgi:hypothetical protein